MKNYPHPVIAREGWFYIFVSFAVTVAVTWLWGVWSLPLWLISLFVLQFFRDPARTVPDVPNGVVSPADGRIVVIEKTQDVYGQREALKISVFMNIFNVHSNRFPVDGEVESVHYFPGKFVNADLDKASLENERNAVIIRMENGQMVTCVQVAGLVGFYVM